jgi:protein AaeX
MIPLREIDILGVFVTPASVCLLAGLLSSLVLRRVLDHLGIDRIFWNRSLVDLSLLVALTSLFILSLRFGG